MMAPPAWLNHAGWSGLLAARYLYAEECIQLAYERCGLLPEIRKMRLVQRFRTGEFYLEGSYNFV